MYCNFIFRNFEPHNPVKVPYLSSRWRSLEAVPASCDELSDVQSKKSIPRHSLKNWLVGLFNGNGLKSSNTSLRRGVLNEYNNLQPEKESIV